jgi:hypothetical protein
MPRKADAGNFGRRTTLPSGCTKNLTRSPGFNPRCLRTALGIVACPFTVIADSMVAPLLPYKCNTKFAWRQAARLQWQPALRATLHKGSDPLPTDRCFNSPTWRPRRQRLAHAAVPAVPAMIPRRKARLAALGSRVLRSSPRAHHKSKKTSVYAVILTFRVAGPSLKNHLPTFRLELHGCVCRTSGMLALISNCEPETILVQLHTRIQVVHRDAHMIEILKDAKAHGVNLPESLYREAGIQ